MEGIYIHIPFCKKICNYCDFYKMVVSDSYKEKYIDYLIKDLKNTISKYNVKKINTIYIGGGTPSCLPLNLLEKVFKTLLESFELEKLDEFTIEANPEDINIDFIKLIKKYYISRISIGVQTFHMKYYPVLGRFTEFEYLKKVISLLKENDLTNYSFDLIYAIPGSNLSDLEEDLIKLISLKPKHISTYSLILEERTILYNDYLKHKVEMINEDLDSQMYKKIKNILEKNNYRQYETSNFSLEGYESKHNLIYWNCNKYFGIGPAASSFIDNIRFTKITNMNRYYQMLDNDLEPVDEYEYLDSLRLMGDYVMLGLRKTEGINLKDFENRFGICLFEKFKKINELIKQNMLLKEDDFLKISDEYIYISNFIISKILFD